MPAQARVVAAFTERYRAEPRVFFAPGRVNLIGAHVDYNGGSVLPLPTDRGTWVAVARRSDDRVRLVSLDVAGDHDLGCADTPAPVELGWAAYAFGMLMAARDRGLDVGGIDLLVHGDLPRGAGLSSSASLEVASGLAMSELFGWGLRPRAIAEMAWHVETEYVGLQCGVMDQFAVALGRDRHALLLDCSTRAWSHVPFPDGCELVVLDTRKPRTLVESAYNERVAECREALRILNERSEATRPWLAECTPAEVDARREALGETLWRRARHVTTEVARVREFVSALELGDLAAMGRQMSACHASCAQDYEVSCAELDGLVQAACAVDGVFGARLTGAGFGGCALALQRPGALDEAARGEIVREFAARFGYEPAFHAVRRGTSPGEVG